MAKRGQMGFVFVHCIELSLLLTIAIFVLFFFLTRKEEESIR